MATYYIDFENGNDANAGTSFAQRWKTITNGATAARIAPGDTICIMASPDPTSIGSATWTGGWRPATQAIASSTNATPIVITSSVAHNLVPGDYVMITGHLTNSFALGVWKVGATPTSTTFQILQMDGSNTTGNGAGTGGTFTKVNNCIVKTASPLVQNIALCGGQGQKAAWTASANVTCALSTSSKEGYASLSLAIAAGFTTGKAAYYTLPSTLDLSGYQQVSFWVNQTTGTVGAAGQTYVALCSDTTGDTVVHQCPVPSLGSNSVWVPVTVNLGTNLNSAIRSVAFYVVTDLGAQTFYLDNIIACKAASSVDSLNLQSLISKSNGTGDEAWYAIQSINYDAIMLANATSNAPNSVSIKGYSGTSETVTTYKRETIKTPIATASTSQISIINDSGTQGSPITFSGGWNRTDMSTQTGRTWLDGLNGGGYSIYNNFQNYITVDRIDTCRYSTGYYFTSGGVGTTITTAYSTACTYGLNIVSYPNGMILGNIWANNNNSGIYLVGSVGVGVQQLIAPNNANGINFDNCQSCYVSNLYSYNCGTVTTSGSINVSGSQDCFVSNLQAGNTIGSGVYASNCNNFSINGGTINPTGNYGVYYNSNVTLYLNNVTINQATETFAAANSGTVYANRLDATDGNNWVFYATRGTVNQQTSVVDSPATSSWLMRPNNALATDVNPVKLKLGTVVCAANSLVTVTARMRRNNTGLTMRLICPGGQISGVSSDVTSDMTAAANTWETVTITFTPTKPGGVDIYAYAFGGSTYSGYVCNLTASQA